MEFDQQQPSYLREQIEALQVELNKGNTAGKMDLEADLDLNAVALGLGLQDTVYEPDVFPGLIYKLNEQKATAILYENGLVTTVDAPSEKTIQDVYDTITEHLTEIGVIENQSSRTATVPAETVPIPTTISLEEKTHEQTSDQPASEDKDQTAEEHISKTTKTDSMTRDDIGGSVYQLLQELDQGSLADLIADFCTVNGWFSEVQLENSPQYAEILATKTLPYPESVRIIVPVTTRLDDEDVQEIITRSSGGGHLSTIVVKEKPTDEALMAAQEEGISIVGIGDLTEDILSQGMVELVVDYARKFDRIIDEYDDKIAALKRQSGTSTGEPIGTSEESDDASNSSTQPRDRPYAENDRLSVGLIGYDFYIPSSSAHGVFVAVKIEAKQPVELSAEDFSLSFTGGTQRSSVSQADSSFLSPLARILQPAWAFGSLSLDEGETIKYVLYVPQSGDDERPKAVFVDNLKVSLIPPLSSHTYRGLPGPMVSVMTDFFKTEFKKGHQESYVSYGVDTNAAEQEGTHTPGDSQDIKQALQDDFPDYQESTVYPSVSGDVPGTIGKYFSLELLGYTYLTHIDEPGMLLAVSVGSRAFDLDIRLGNFTLHSDDEVAYEGDSSATILDQVAQSLPPSWSAERSEVSAGGKRTYLLFFPSERDFTPTKLRYRSTYKRLFTMGSGQVKEQTGETKYDEVTLDVELDSTHAERTQGVFKGKSKILDSILAVQGVDHTAGEKIYREILSEEIVGVEHGRFAAEISAWDFYQSTGSDEYQSGIFISVDLTAKLPDTTFNYEWFSAVDTEGYRYEGRKSSVLRDISRNNSLLSSWELPAYTDISVPADGTIKTLVHIPSAEPITPAQIRLEGWVLKAVKDVPSDTWTGLRGLPTTVDAVLSSMGYERKSE